MQKKSSGKSKEKVQFMIREKYMPKCLKEKTDASMQENKQNLQKKALNFDRKAMRTSHKQLLPIMKNNHSNSVLTYRKKDIQLAGFTKHQIPNSLVTSKNIYISKKKYKKQEQLEYAQNIEKIRDKKQNGFQRQLDIRNRVVQLKRRGIGILYYLSDIKKQMSKVCKGIEDPNIFLAHFYQSIATFHLFPNIRLPRQPHMSIQLPLQVNQNKKNLPTLIFDMDQTLLHCSQGNQGNPNLVSFQIQIGQVFLNCEIRPHARQTLERLSKTFEIGVFTAGRQSYATAMLNYLDPQNKFFTFKLFRQHCHPHHHSEGCDPLNVKDLRIIKNRDLKKVILIDNSAHTYLFQPQNAIPIVSFYEDQQDTQLLKLQKFLLTPQIMNSSDVRPFLKNYFRLHDYKRFKSAKQICNKLY